MNFLERLAARAHAAGPRLRPRVASRFEAGPDLAPAPADSAPEPVAPALPRTVAPPEPPAPAPMRRREHAPESDAPALPAWVAPSESQPAATPPRVQAAEPAAVLAPQAPAHNEPAAPPVSRVVEHRTERAVETRSERTREIHSETRVLETQREIERLIDRQRTERVERHTTPGEARADARPLPAGATPPRAAQFRREPAPALPVRAERAPLPVAQEPVAPTIHVTIGRVDVRAVVAPAAATPRPASPAAPSLSLDEYLARRGGER